MSLFCVSTPNTHVEKSLNARETHEHLIHCGAPTVCWLLPASGTLMFQVECPFCLSKKTNPMPRRQKQFQPAGRDTLEEWVKDHDRPEVRQRAKIPLMSAAKKTQTEIGGPPTGYPVDPVAPWPASVSLPSCHLALLSVSRPHRPVRRH